MNKKRIRCRCGITVGYIPEIYDERRDDFEYGDFEPNDNFYGYVDDEPLCEDCFDEVLEAKEKEEADEWI